MTGVRITVSSTEVLVRLGQLFRRLDDLSPAMREVAGVLADETEQAFEDQADPSTQTPWQALAASTIASREEAGTWPGGILQVEGQLAASISQDHGRDFAVVGSNLVYAAIHQRGGPAGRGLSTQIPARPFLGISDEGEAEVLEIIERFLGF